ncbi:MAG TPA: hypothetical protein VGF40_07850 [Thermoanaerobaculia bacterium]
MRLDRLRGDDETRWREEFLRENWTFGALTLSITLPEFAEGQLKVQAMHFGYYLQPLHLAAFDREDLPRRLLSVLARRKPPLDFLELIGAGVRIPHCFPTGFTIDSVLRITLLELKRLPVSAE